MLFCQKGIIVLNCNRQQFNQDFILNDPIDSRIQWVSSRVNLKYQTNRTLLKTTDRETLFKCQK